MKRIGQWLVLGLCCLAGAVAHAQWQWVDKDGRKVFSDRAPPPDIPARNILRQPGSSARGVAAAPVAAASAPGATASAPMAANEDAAATPRLSGVDKDLAEKKKLAEAAAAAKARADAERLQKVKADNCERAKANKALMDSGVRVSHTKPNGEREILDDAGRAAELKRIQTVMETNCN